VNILVAGQPIKEIQYGGKIYVVTEYDTSASYKVWVEDESPFGEVEGQHWPFTPFELLVTYHAAIAEYFCVKVRIDGVDACMKFIRGTEHSIRIKGFQGILGNDRDMKEFCFSPPRPVKKSREHDPKDKITSERLLDLGSIVITIHKATLHCVENIVIDGSAVNFAEANKEVTYPCQIFE
jgi:hypothetical protein